MNPAKDVVSFSPNKKARRLTWCFSLWFLECKKVILFFLMGRKRPGISEVRVSGVRYRIAENYAVCKGTRHDTMSCFVFQ